MKFKVSLITLVLTLLFVFPAFSTALPETAFKVKGTLVDSISGETIPYVTISVSSTEKPDVYLKRLAAGVNGDFEFVLNKTDNYVLSFESIGMQKQLLNVSIIADKKLLNLGKINMSASDAKLSEVTVLANKPLVKVDLDKITYDTKSDPESQSSTVLEMLKKVPMVTVDGEDKIQVKGSSNFKVYMNGKPSNMMSNNPSQVLKSIPASSIKNIEIITEPGAKYDAEGLGGIINIVTDRSLNGFMGTIRAGADTNGGYNTGLFLSTKIGKFGLTTNLNYNKQKNPGSLSVNERENYDALATKYVLQNSNNDTKYHFNHGNVEASYEFDSLNLVSFTVGGYGAENTTITNGNSSFFNADRDVLSSYSQSMESKGGWGGIDMSLDYQRTFKKPDQLFTLSYKLSSSPVNSDYLSDIKGIVNYKGSVQRIKSVAQGDEHTFQLDYTEPFNKKHVMELGAKYILRLNNSDNTYLQQNETSLDWEPDVNRVENDLNHKQHILGAYGSYTLKLKKFSVRTGVRLEKTWSYVELPDTNFNVSLTNLVPSISMTYRFSDASNLRLSYNQRISRPGIWYLNPFWDDSNPQSISQGNPDLKSEIDNSFALNYSYITQKFNLNSSVYTSFTNNSIEQVNKSLNDGVIYSTYKNIGLSQNVGMSLYANWQPNKTIRINGNSSVDYSHMSTNDGSGLQSDGYNYSLSGGGQLTLPGEIKLSLNGGFYSPRIMLQGRYSGFYYYSSSLSRDFINKKLNISLSAQNPFEKTRSFNGYNKTETYRSDFTSTMLARSFRISVSYRFGEMKEQIKKAQRSINNDDVKGGGGQSGSGGQ